MIRNSLLRDLGYNPAKINVFVLPGVYMSKLILLATLTTVFVLFSFTSLADSKMPDDHLHGIDNCARCHNDGIDISKIIMQDKSCQQCHSVEILKTFAVKLAKGEYSERHANSDVHHGAQALDDSKVYYQGSKYGDAPNPMITIPAGKFTMGTNERLSDEGPQHEVTLASFQIDQYEVTNAQYKKFIDATKRKSPSHFRNRTYPAGKPDHPVTYVNWHDAKAYCEWAGKRLPTDQEWEKAARGTDGRTYPWGNDFEIENGNTPVRWQSLNKFGDTMPIAMFPNGKSPYGLLDMSGNVWEWTESWYKAYPNNKIESENYGERYKTLKGGSWFDCSFYKCGISAPVYNRAFFAKKVKNDTFGFRCAKDL